MLKPSANTLQRVALSGEREYIVTARASFNTASQNQTAICQKQQGVGVVGEVSYGEGIVLYTPVTAEVKSKSGF